MIDCILSKEEFVKILDNLKETEVFYDKINDVLKNYGADGYIFPPTNIDDVIFLLDKIFEQDRLDSWISYFVYELEFGKNYEEGTITYQDGTIIDLSNSGKLYDFLIKEMEVNHGK